MTELTIVGLIWLVSIIINIVAILKFTKEEKGRITYLGLLSFFVFGIIIAPLLTGIILIGAAIKFHNKLSNMDSMNKTLYKFK